MRDKKATATTRAAAEAEAIKAVDQATVAVEAVMAAVAEGMAAAIDKRASPAREPVGE